MQPAPFAHTDAQQEAADIGNEAGFQLHKTGKFACNIYKAADPAASRKCKSCPIIEQIFLSCLARMTGQNSNRHTRQTQEFVFVVSLHPGPKLETRSEQDPSKTESDKYFLTKTILYMQYTTVKVIT